MAKAAVAEKPALKQNERVQSVVDLPRVPKGTMGTVTMVSGLTWIRYWVRFDNGERVGTVHRDKLVNHDDVKRLSAPAPAAVAVSTGGPAVVGDAGAAMESVGGVPGYLIERSKQARVRWAAKTAA